MDWVIGTVTVWYQASLDEPIITKFKDYAGLTFSCSVSLALQTLPNLVCPE